MCIRDSSSARETASRVVAGAIAKQILAKQGIEIFAYVDQVGAISMQGEIRQEDIDKNIVRTANLDDAKRMEELIQLVRKSGDTVGGSVSCQVLNLPAGIGEPVFDKLHAELGKAMLSINAVKGFEYGSGFEAIEMNGSEHNDAFNADGSTKTNHSGGIQGGISNGMPINMRIAFKPVATIVQEQDSINSAGDEVKVKGKGRHDPCVVPRAVPIVEAMAAITILDLMLRANAVKLS
mgnify:CR=1 FL=1